MKQVIIIVSILYSISSLAQQSKPIETDRPGETQSTSTVDVRKLQLEAAVHKEQNENDYSILHPSTVIRYGVSKHFEVRADITIETHKFPGDALTGLNPVELGFKLMLKEAKGAAPEVSLISHFAIPKLASKDFDTPVVLPEVRLLLMNELSKKSELEYNLGAKWDEPGKSPGWLYTISPNFEITHHLHIYVELYGEVRKHEKPEHVVDGSIAWMVNDNFQLDINGGTGISENAPKYLLSAGLSVRL